MNPRTCCSPALVACGDPHPGRPLREGPVEGSILFPTAPLLPRGCPPRSLPCSHSCGFSTCEVGRAPWLGGPGATRRSSLVPCALPAPVLRLCPLSPLPSLPGMFRWLISCLSLLAPQGCGAFVAGLSTGAAGVCVALLSAGPGVVGGGGGAKSRPRLRCVSELHASACRPAVLPVMDGYAGRPVCAQMTVALRVPACPLEVHPRADAAAGSLRHGGTLSRGTPEPKGPLEPCTSISSRGLCSL